MLYVTNTQALGGRVRAARKARGWTNKRLAHEAHVAQGTIVRIEHGDPTRAGSLESVLHALDLDPDTLDGLPSDIQIVMQCVAEWLLPMSAAARLRAVFQLGQLIGGDRLTDSLDGATRSERRAIDDARSEVRHKGT